MYVVKLTVRDVYLTFNMEGQVSGLAVTICHGRVFKLFVFLFLDALYLIIFMDLMDVPQHKMYLAVFFFVLFNLKKKKKKGW